MKKDLPADGVEKPLSNPGQLIGALTVYPQPNVVAGVKVPLELATLSYPLAVKLWRRIYFRRMLFNPFLIVSMVVLVVLFGLGIVELLTFRGNLANLRGLFPWIAVALGLSYLAVIGSVIYNVRFIRSWMRIHPLFAIRRAEISDEVIQRVGEPPFATLRIYGGVVRAPKRKQLLDFPFESGLYEQWVESYGKDEAGKRFWRYVYRQGWRFNWQDFGLQLRNVNNIDVE